jgi:hypothetical protein
MSVDEVGIQVKQGKYLNGKGFMGSYVFAKKLA